MRFDISFKPPCPGLIVRGKKKSQNKSIFDLFVYISLLFWYDLVSDPIVRDPVGHRSAILLLARAQFFAFALLWVFGHITIEPEPLLFRWGGT